MNLTDIREKTWEILEMDVEELPTSLIDLFAVDGYNRIIGTDRRWPFFQETSVLTTVASVGRIPLSDAAFSTELKEIAAVIDSSGQGRLDFITYQDGVERYGLTETGTPETFSIWGDSLYLWPIPDTANTLDVVGYRAANAWSSDASTEMDCDPDFHMSVLYFVLSRSYARMEDTELAQFYEQMFVSGVTSATSSVLRRNSGDNPLILHGGTKRARRTYSPLVSE